MEITDESSVPISSPPVEKRSIRWNMSKKRFLTLFILLLLIVATAILLSYVFGLFKEFSPSAEPSPTPTNEATSSGKRVPSSLAIEPDFLKLEEDLGTMEKDLNAVDLSEPKLSPPIIELNVNFGR